MSHEDDPRLFRSLWNLLRASLKTILLLALAAFYYFYPMFREPRERLLIAEKLTIDEKLQLCVDVHGKAEFSDRDLQVMRECGRLIEALKIENEHKAWK
jgi:hypothetical protein